GQTTGALAGAIFAYNNLLKAQLTLTQQRRNLALLRKIAARTEQRYRNGWSDLIEVNRRQMAFAKNERAVFQACQAVAGRSAMLAEAIGMSLPPGHILKLAEPLPSPGGIDISRQAVDAAIRNNPSVQAAKERVTISRKKLAQARAAFYPKLSLVGRYDWLGQSRDSLASAYYTTSPNSYRVELVLQQSLGPFTSEDAAVASAQADIERARDAYRQTVLAVETQYRTILSARLESRLATQSAERSVKQARGILRLSRQLAAHGQINLNALDSARLTVNKAAAQAAELKLDSVLYAWLSDEALHPRKFISMLMNVTQGQGGRSKLK
ncbi:MAG TPA: hypothetical protein DEP05_09375, partial [Betaproteobacteria bacterium]|nr:hypothetical protein [Betaproteobacteria bacterium]